MRLESAERRRAGDELLRFQTLVRVADASAGGDGSQERLNGWSERLQRQAGVALTREQKAAMNAQRMIDSAKQHEIEKKVARARAEAQARKREKSKK